MRTWFLKLLPQAVVGGGGGGGGGFRSKMAAIRSGGFLRYFKPGVFTSYVSMSTTSGYGIAQ